MSDSILTLPPPPYDERIRYGDAPQHFADVRFPHTNRAAPALFTIHGGYWRAKYDLAYMGNFCAAITSAGVVTINIEYRRVGDPGGGWPATFDDVQRAFDYVVEHAAELRIDPELLMVAGHSAGAQLAVCLAANEPARIRKVVSLAGVLDLQRAWELHLSNDAVVEFLGGTPDEVPERYAAASPIGLSVPKVLQTVVHGARDNDVPTELSRHYAHVKKERGEKLEYLKIPGADHFDLIDPRSKAWHPVA